MAMRYLIRRTKSEDLADIKRDVPDLDSQLGTVGSDQGTAGADYRKQVELRLTPNRHITYQFIPKKSGANWIWTCPSIELVAEDDAGLYALCDRLKAPHPSHLPKN